MKKKTNHFNTAAANDLKNVVGVDRITEENKSRLFPEAFYLRWELELLFALVATIVLLVLPGWLNKQVDIFFSARNTSMNTDWITVACNLLAAGFGVCILGRMLWLYFVNKRGDSSTKKLHFVKLADHLAEFAFSACVIILIMIVLISVIQFLDILLINTVSGRIENMGEIK
jgi:hypothetical protein